MMRLTNYFSGFDNKPANHEDSLTRAFLVLLRLVLPVQATFIDAIREAQYKNGHREVVPPRTAPDSDITKIRTQIGRLDADEGLVLSVLLTNQEWESDGDIEASERTAVYDGLIHYGDQWIFVVENKPYGDVRESQLHPNTDGAEGLKVIPKPVVLIWKDIIRRLHALEQGNWLDYAEQKLVDDFLRYVRDDFHQLNPYPTLETCQGDIDLLNRRCVDLMQEIAPDRVETHKGWKSYIEAPELEAARMVAVSAEEQEDTWEIELAIHPADTVSQARSFYSQVDIDALLALEDEWDCTPNLHFSHISKNLVYPRSSISLEHYIDFWCEHPEWIRQVKEEEFDELIELLDRYGMMTAAGHEAFEEKFVQTNRSTANVCPGVSLYYRWPRAKAVELDRNERLAEEIDARVHEAVPVWRADQAWGEIVAESHAEVA